MLVIKKYNTENIAENIIQHYINSNENGSIKDMSNIISNAVINPSKYTDITSLNNIASKSKHDDREYNNHATPKKFNIIRKSPELASNSDRSEEIMNNNQFHLPPTINKEKAVTEFAKRYGEILGKYGTIKSSEQTKQAYQSSNSNSNKVSLKGTGLNTSGKALFNKYEHIVKKYLNKENIGDNDSNGVLESHREFESKYEKLFMVKDSDDHKVCNKVNIMIL